MNERDEETEIFKVELDEETYDALKKKADQASMSLDDYCTIVLTNALKNDEFEKMRTMHK